MIIKLLKKTTIYGAEFSKDSMVNVPRAMALDLCASGHAISNEDVACNERQKKAAKKRSKKKQENEEGDLSIDIQTDL